LRWIALLSAIVAATVAIGETGALAAGAHHSADTARARLEGGYILNGRVTVATAVRGEHVGEHLTRRWKFTPTCSTASCPQVGLTRGRSPTANEVVLRRVAPGRYRGSGIFYRPLRCGRRLYARGEKAPFTITVRVTAAVDFDGVIVATAIHARYASPRRINLTRCVLPPTRESAVYRGHLIPT
jgi:hypothetical protein